MTDGPASRMSFAQIRSWLEGKRAAGVTQVRITSVLAALPDKPPRPSKTRAQITEEVIHENVGRDAFTHFDLDSQKNVFVAGDIVGTAEAAAVLNVERPRIGRYRALGKMPEPIAVLAAGPVWWRADVEKLRDTVEERRKPTRGPGEAGPGRPGNARRVTSATPPTLA